jgi:mono/diheme cytochrome c family protein
MRIQAQIFCGLVITVMLLGLLFFAAANEYRRLDEADKAQRALSIEVGAGLYEIHCRTCHGAKGEGVGQLGPAISDKNFFTTRLAEIGWQDTLKAYVFATSAHGRLMATRSMYAGDGKTAVMAPWLDKYGGPLRDDQVRDIAAFVENWEPTALGKVELIELELPKTNLSDPQAVARGRQLFLEKCATCHTIQKATQAQKRGPELTRIAAVATARKADLSAEEYIRESVLVPNAYIVEGFEPEKVGYRCGGILSERQLDEIVAFLLTQK